MSEVLPHLERISDEADDGTEFVLTHFAHKNYRNFFINYLDRAGLKLWPALFTNPRGSAATYAHSWLPPYVCYKWFGHSKDMFLDHYGQVTEEHYKIARQRPSSTPQQASEMAENSGTPKKESFEQNAQSPLGAADYGEWLKSAESLNGRCRTRTRIPDTG